MEVYFKALTGGALIGLASVMMLLFNGKILGISGIAGGILEKRGDKAWRWYFLGGLLAGGLVILLLVPGAFVVTIPRSPLALMAAGLLVGFGTRLGNGCTSGHGVCGISRLQPRSLMATLTFIFFGAASVYVINHLLGGVL